MKPIDVKALNQAVANFYEQSGKSFSATRHGHWSGFDLVKEILKSGDSVLDVGAGNGRLAEVLPTDVTYLGIEPSSSFRGSAKTGVQMLAGDLSRLPVADGQADLTACFAVLQHVPPEEQVAARDELIRVTKIEGRIVATSWLPSSADLEPIEGRSEFETWVPWKADGIEAKRYVYIFTINMWKQLWTCPGIEIERIGYLHEEGWTEDVMKARNVGVVAKVRILSKQKKQAHLSPALSLRVQP